MTAFTRAMLREIVDLGARSQADKIPYTDIERQERTVIRALELLANQPGVMLADEVGMGKTFEALGVAAVVHHRRKNAKIVVITPGPQLNIKWVKELRHFSGIHEFGGVAAAGSLGEFVEAVRASTVVVAPMTIFQRGRGVWEQGWLLSLFIRWKGLHGRTGNALRARYRDGALEPVNVEAHRFFGRFAVQELGPRALDRAFRRGRGSTSSEGLDDLYEEGGHEAFRDDRRVRRALHRAQCVLAGSLLPTIDLLIVDEAHKLKNAAALRTIGLRTTTARRYHKALFLTATPFQLDVSELRQVFDLFFRAKGVLGEGDTSVDELLAAISDYQRSYGDFQATWTDLELGMAKAFRDLYDRDPDLTTESSDPSLRRIAAQVRELLRLKDAVIEPGLRRWMIRSLREGKREHRAAKLVQLDPGSANPLPFLIYERFIAELFRNPQERGTHKAAAQINMVSSYEAARSGALLHDDSAGRFGPEASAYRELLRSILATMAGEDQAHHAKIRFSVRDALCAATKGEKTLVFCARVASLSTLKQHLDRAWDEYLIQRWREVFPAIEADAIFDREVIDPEGSTRRVVGKHGALRKRLHARTDVLSLALRERYLDTVVPIAGWAREHVDDLLDEANARLRGLRLRRSSAERRDFQIARRCVEQAAVCRWRERDAPTEALVGSIDDEGCAALLDPQFLSFGIDLADDPYELDKVGEHEPRWSIDRALALEVIGSGRSLWAGCTALLVKLDVGLRVRVIEQLAHYLTFQQVPFLAELLATAKDADVEVESIESAALLRFIDRFWELPVGQRWRERMHEFLRYFVDREESHRVEILEEVLEKQRVAFARHTRDGTSRERLREAFNTPLFPMMLIANEIMQEGVDLHHSCRRVTHHDLTWNPAQLEQRVGRVDRLGSRLLRVRETDKQAKLDVLFPLIRGTIDEHLYEVVRRREQWLEFLLGAAPDLKEYRLGDEAPPPLPKGLAARLAVHLGPRTEDHTTTSGCPQRH